MSKLFVVTPRFENILLCLFDLLCLFLSITIAQFIRFGTADLFSNIPSLLIVVISTIMVFYIFDLYQVKRNIKILHTPGRTIVANICSFLLINLYIYFAVDAQYSGNFFGRGVLITAVVIFTILSSLSRIHIFKKILRSKNKFTWNYITSISQDLIKYDFHNSINFVETILPEEDQKAVTKINSLKNSSTVGIVISDQTTLSNEVGRALMELRFTGVRVYSLSQFYEKVLLKIPVDLMKDTWFTMSGGFDLVYSRTSLRAKRIIDLILAFVISVLSAPLLFFGMMIVKTTSKGPIFYSQVRVGEKGKNFTIYKLRSMTTDAEKDGAKWAQKNDSRVTPIGKFIRATRIDELPQLFNVFKGDMSFIGPRPERPEFTEQLAKEIPYFNLRHLVKPGLTGWAQVYYPYGASVEDAKQKLQYDLYYIKNFSLIMDFSILLKTIRIVLLGKGR